MATNPPFETAKNTEKVHEIMESCKRTRSGAIHGKNLDAAIRKIRQVFVDGGASRGEATRLAIKFVNRYSPLSEPPEETT